MPISVHVHTRTCVALYIYTSLMDHACAAMCMHFCIQVCMREHRHMRILTKYAHTYVYTNTFMNAHIVKYELREPTFRAAHFECLRGGKIHCENGWEPIVCLLARAGWLPLSRVIAVMCLLIRRGFLAGFSRRMTSVECC